MSMHKNSKKYIAFSIVIALVLFLGGFFLGSSRPSTAGASVVNTKADFTEFWKVWTMIDEKFPDASTISAEDRIIGATKGLVDSLGDKYSVFFDKEETKSFQESIQGSFGGVGIEIDEKDGILVVIAPIKGTPADKAGVQSGDYIIKIDDITTEGLSIDEAIKKIRGAEGTPVTLTLLSKDSKTTRDIKLIRAKIEIPTLETKKLNPPAGGGVFVVSLYNFNAHAMIEFRKAMEEFKSYDGNKLIIDLRGNPGGYLDASIDMASYFIPAGKTIVTENYGENKSETIHRSKGYSLGKKNLKVAILIDQGSASASEILAGALQDYKLATLVGTQTYGKGSVQELVPVTDTTTLKLTIAKWLTPNRNWISKQGLTPDFKVENKTRPKETGDSTDLQFAKAVEVVNK